MENMRHTSGFLLIPLSPTEFLNRDAPIPAEVRAALETLRQNTPDELQRRTFRRAVSQLPPFDAAWLANADEALLEYLMLLYGCFASAYVYGAAEKVTVLPAALAVPLAAVARQLDRPPMLAYASMVLNNWRLRDQVLGITVHNTDVLARFTDLPDEAWFFRVHMAIEARAGRLLGALQQAIFLANLHSNAADEQLTLQLLRLVATGIVDLTRIFHRIVEDCDPDIYYQHIRPLLFGFESVIYEGVAEFEGQPQSFRGGSGAQSSIVPAVLAGLGIRHEQNSLTTHLHTMRAYMPIAHRRYIDALDGTALRARCAEKPPLRDAYNQCLRHLMTFRRAHLYYAKTYIFEKSTNPIGTGGTPFMHFLAQLIAETEAHLLKG
jgi:indoleamine 2,3-dioxygenase